MTEELWSAENPPFPPKLCGLAGALGTVSVDCAGREDRSPPARWSSGGPSSLSADFPAPLRQLWVQSPVLLIAFNTYLWRTYCTPRPGIDEHTI